MKEFLVVTLAVAAGFPALIALMSFVMMQNGFRVLGAGYIVRVVIVLEVLTDCNGYSSRRCSMNIPTYQELEDKVLELAVQLANAESKCRELAAESAGMKQLASEAYDEMVSHHDTDGLYSLDADGEQMDALIRLCDAQATIYDTLVMCDTPATDAFLAEVQAQGVEMFADSLKVVGGHEHPYSVVANEFAAQLRKGGAA